MSALDDLLVLQEHDTVIEQLRHRRETLPERGALREVESARVALAAELAAAVAARDEVASRQASLERDIATSEARIAEIDKRLYSGSVTASRDLQAMQHEIDSIKHRVSTLEDSALAAMEEREPLDAAVSALDEQDASLVARGVELAAAIVSAEASIDSELAGEVSARASSAALVDGALVEEYEKLRARLDGIGAARLEHGTCMGCRMKLPATELDRLKREPADAVVHCDQCGRILVR
jgi:predicted  nucleic acid-binding Zn-ribbon protein